ncbi:MAG TPA: GldG family protein [Isosphaeraceae bacterium]|nr:GldG family protein [Isosphaeraceae bacterium]
MVEKVLSFLGRGEVWVAGSALVVFLVLTWVLRGAPPGQAVESEDDLEAPRAGYRDRIVAAVVVGLLLILGGAYVAIDRGIPWSLPLFALGFGLLLLLIRLNRRYRHASPSLRRTIEFAGSFLNTSLLAGLLIVINVLAFRYGGRPLDLTREGTYSLSSSTLNQLTSLDRPLTFTMIFGRGQVALQQRDRVVQLLEAYHTINPRLIQVTSLDPYTDLTRVEDLVKRVPDLSLLHGGGVLLEYGAGQDAEFRVVRNQEMFEPIRPDQIRSNLDRFESVFTGEDAITSALIRLREGKKAKVAFTTGHKEPDTSDLDPRGKGIGNWKSRLSAIGCEVVDLKLLEAEIPEDLTLLMVVNPSDPFKPSEVAKLRAYADRGGPILLIVGNASPSGLEDFLKSFNLEIGRGIVIDPRSKYEGKLELVLAPARSGAAHPIVAAMDPNRLVLLPQAAPIHVYGMSGHGGTATQPLDRSLVPTVILRTSPYSWAETDPSNPRPTLDRSADEPGPVTVGVAVARRAGEARPGVVPEEQPRLVLFSCATMADNILQQIAPTNLDLLMNCVSWLRGRPDTLGIPAKSHVALTLAVDEQLRSRLIMVPSVTAMMLIIALGLIVYVARRE